MKPNLQTIGNRSLILLLLLLTGPPLCAQIKYGNSYVNLSKKTTGGTVQPGDTLEIRTNYYFPTGYNSNNIYFSRFVANIPSNTMYIGDSLRLITNEGLTYKRWTNASDADMATYKATPGTNEYNIRMNVGTGTTAPTDNTVTTGAGGGNLKPNTSLPRAGSGLLVTTAFKVKVTGAVGDTIVLGESQFRYKLSNNVLASDQTVSATRYKILITNNTPICPDAVGRNFVAEAGGTFDSGTTHNRSYGPTYAIPGYNYLPLTAANQTGDGNYTIVKNLSPYESTNRNARKKPNCTAPLVIPALDTCKNRMFDGHWEIIGDHTGSSTAAGNDPAAPGSRGGYMLVVNADYATSEAYRQDITGLCPNTSYEFSLWVRNVCTNCGIDSSGTQTWKPGVYPNLTFAIDNLDRYSSGQVDTTGWMKKGFMFKTGQSQTSITISIRNNASGGGGNDWAIDDIALVTCNPNLDMAPSPNSAACYGQQVDVFAVVKSYFDNYTFWTWDVSSDNGATWTNTGISGQGTPVLNNGMYQYTATYPSFLGDSAHHNLRYRVRVASTASNLLNGDCSFDANTRIQILVNNCQWLLSTKLVSFDGILKDGYARLDWVSENEEDITVYEIEKSYDGSHFTRISSMPGKAGRGKGASYPFTDPAPVSGTAWYRLKIIEKGNYKYSRVVLLSNQSVLGIFSLTNPFDGTLSFELSSTETGTAIVTLIDTYGRTLRSSRLPVNKGLNPLTLYGLEPLGNGAYTLRIQINEKVINKHVVKLNK